MCLYFIVLQKHFEVFKIPKWFQILIWRILSRLEAPRTAFAFLFWCHIVEVVTQTNLNKQNEPSPADLCQIPWKGFAHSKRIDPLYVVIQRLSEWGVFCWSVRCDPGGTLGFIGSERDSCLVVFVTVGRHKSPRTLRGCRCSTLRNVHPPLPAVIPGLTPAYKAEVICWE